MFSFFLCRVLFGGKVTEMTIVAVAAEMEAELPAAANPPFKAAIVVVPSRTATVTVAYVVNGVKDLVNVRVSNTWLQ